MTDVKVLDELGFFSARRTGIIIPPGATTDVINSDATSNNSNWVETSRVTDHVGFFLVNGVRKFGVTQGGIYTLTVEAQVDMYGPTMYAAVDVKMPGYTPKARVTVSDYNWAFRNPINITACIPDEGGWIEVTCTRNVDPAQSTTEQRHIGLHLWLTEIVPAAGYIASGAPAATAPGVVTARARNTGMRFA